MTSHFLDRVTRRELVRAGLLLGAGVFLTGCASSRRSASNLPGPRWPTMPASRPRPTIARPNTPAEPSYTPDSSVIPRSEWASAAPIPARMDRMLPVSRITVHHDGMPPVTLYSRSDVARRIDQIRDSHQGGRGWGDIAYHYVVDPSGQVWEGRPLAWQGAHVKDQNPGNLGIVCLGNFEMQSPSSAQVASLEQFVASQMRRYNVSMSRVRTHRELAPTVCPGRNLQRIMDRTRSDGALARA